MKHYDLSALIKELQDFEVYTVTDNINEYQLNRLIENCRKM